MTASNLDWFYRSWFLTRIIFQIITASEHFNSLYRDPRTASRSAILKISLVRVRSGPRISKFSWSASGPVRGHYFFLANKKAALIRSVSFYNYSELKNSLLNSHDQEVKENSSLLQKIDVVSQNLSNFRKNLLKRKISKFYFEKCERKASRIFNLDSGNSNIINRLEITIRLIHRFLTKVDLQSMKIHNPMIYFCAMKDLTL